MLLLVLISACSKEDIIIEPSQVCKKGYHLTIAIRGANKGPVRWISSDSIHNKYVQHEPDKGILHIGSWVYKTSALTTKCF